MNKVIVFIFSSLLATANIYAQNNNKPNVIFIVADDLGNGDVGYNGTSNIPTPNIDRIAKEGVIFDTGYVTAAVCGPSRAGFMTGKYGQSFGFEDNPGPFRQNETIKPGIPTSEKMLSEYMKEAGYKTAAYGKWHIGGIEEATSLMPTNRGFDEYYGFLEGANAYYPIPEKNNPMYEGLEKAPKNDTYLTDLFAERAISFIEKNKNELFFVYIPFNAVHTPLTAPEKYLKEFKDIEDKKRRTLCAMQYGMDINIGLILDKLVELDLYDNTMIVFISDNGGYPTKNASYNFPYKGHKGDYWEGGIRIPFAIKWPSNIKIDADKFSKPVSSMDVLPTIMAVIGESDKVGDDVVGKNLLPYVQGKNNDAPHEILNWRINAKWAIRDLDWKAVYNQKTKKVELYNISKDISEENDLAQEHPEQVERLTKLHEEWESKMISPQWGWVPRYAGKYRSEAYVNKLDKSNKNNHKKK